MVLTGKLSTHLLSLHPEARVRATQHPFLRSAGDGTISADTLSAWLTQDRLYAMCGYTRLMGHMLARLPVPEAPPTDPRCQEWKASFTTLSAALSNIHREIAFFEETAASNHLSVAVEPRSTDVAPTLGLLTPLTHSYTTYIATLSSHGTFAESAVLLWSMEILYLQAWTYARSFLPSAPSEADRPGVHRALRAFIANWTSDEFVRFVEACREMVDRVPHEELQGEGLRRLERVWETVLWFEERFWEAK